MRRMGKYCKAYPVARFREFSEWTENKQNARTEKKLADGKEVEVTKELTDDDFLYLQENFTVTDCIFLDENVIFDNVTAQWIDFCKTALGFEVPIHQPADIAAKGMAE